MFAQIFIRRPVLAIVISLFLVIAGLISLTALPISQYPEVVPPQVVVTAFFPGADAKTVAETVAIPIEQSVNGVEDMMYMESQCTNDGSMRLTVTFKIGTDVDKAQVLVQNRVATATSKLPELVRRLGVTTKKQSTAILLVVSLFSADDPSTGKPIHDQLEVSNFGTLQVRDQLARIDGVGDVFAFGEREYSVRVWLDPDRMNLKQITPAEVLSAIRAQNAEVAAGQIGQPPTPNGQQFQYVVTAQGRLLDAKAFEEVIVKFGTGEQLIRIKDIARVELGAKNYDTAATLDNRPSLGLPIFQLPGANAFETAARVRAKMEELKKDVFPNGMEYAIVFDPTTSVEASVDAVVDTLIEAIILVFLVVLVFLQSWRSAFIPMLAVPVSLIGTLAFMLMLGYSINNLTLFGLVLAIGIVVDDAIVVVEAVEYHIARGLSPLDATSLAMKEVSGAIIGVALVLCAVFVPASFIPGLTGKFFKQFAITIAVSTVISAFNSLTLSPALCPILLRPHGKKKDPVEFLIYLLIGTWFNWLFNKMTTIYGFSIKWLMRLAIVVLVVYGGLLYFTYTTFRSVPPGFLPQQDQGYLVINVQLPEGASLERTQAVMKKVSDIALTVDGIDHVTSVAGYSIFAQANISSSGGCYISLKPYEKRKKRHADAILADLNAKLATVDEAMAMGFGAPPILGLGNAGGFKMQVLDRGSLGYETLEGMTWNLVGASTKEQGIVGSFSTFRSASPQLKTDIDRDRVAQLGLSQQTVNDTLSVFLGSAYVNDVTLFGRNYQVTVQADAQFRSRVNDIEKLKLRAPSGEMIPLGAVVKVKPTDGPSKVNRYQQFLAADVNGFTIPAMISSGDAIARMEALAKRELPQQMTFEWTDMAFQQNAASNQEIKLPGLPPFKGDTTILVFGLSVLFVFLVLAGLYESWLLPLAIVLIVPMCLLCAVVGLMVAKLDLNIFTQIGLVVLVGLASKNAILIVEFAKQKHESGLSRFDAALEASKQRLRPILMTSFAFILGVLPLVTASGAGAEMRRALGTAVFSGMIGVTIFGIFFTPVFYLVMTWIGERGKKSVTTVAPSSEPTAHH